MKKILLICGHPDKESFNFALAAAYQKGAEASGAEVRRLNIRDLSFQLDLEFGYRKRVELEPDLLAAQESIKWAEHLVWIYPVWWGSVPAIMKGFIDRVFLPGWAFKKKDDSPWWDAYLKGRSAHLISTLDQPGWFYRLRYSRPSYHAMKQLTMNFVGIKKVRTTTIGPLRHSKDSFRTKWLRKVEALGQRVR